MGHYNNARQSMAADRTGRENQEPKIVNRHCTDLAGGAAIEIAGVDFPC